jgi:PhoD-like phosphatase
MAELILGPLLRYVGSCEATVWVETATACEVEVLGHRARTFHVEGHYYAVVYVTALKAATAHAYTVALDGEQVWPAPNSPYPPSTIYTPRPEQPLRIVFGSCRLCLPHTPPYTLAKEEDMRGRGVDALRALAERLCHEPPESLPHALLLLGDQIYADAVSQATRDFIRSRRDPDDPPGEEIADFEEYTRLYRESWSEPMIRWLLSTVPSAMMFDDHDVNDDWNISSAWVKAQRAKPWWHERIVGGFMSYWIYQHLGNLSPRELAQDDLLRQVSAQKDAGPLLRRFAQQADHDPKTCRWSFYRDFGKVRLVMIDARAARVLNPSTRAMIDAQEWEWIQRQCQGEFDHLLLGSSLPVFQGHGIHYLEAWNEAVCAGVWGKWLIGPAERLRQAIDLDHWSAFGQSLAQLVALLREVGSGARGPAPATLVLLSGDVHHAYLAKISYPPSAHVKSAVYQAVCSPLRNALNKNERRLILAGWRNWSVRLWSAIARAAGVTRPEVDWHLTHDEPWFDNQIATLELSSRRAILRLERPTLNFSSDKTRLNEIFSYPLDHA